MHWESTSSAESAAPAGAVWEAIVDGRRWSLWHARFEWMWLEGPLLPGSIVTLKPRRSRQTAFVIVELVPESRLVIETTFGPVASVRVVFDVAAVKSGSSVTYSVIVDGILGSLAVRMIGKRLSDGAPEALAALGEYARTAKKEEAR